MHNVCAKGEDALQADRTPSVITVSPTTVLAMAAVKPQVLPLKMWQSAPLRILLTVSFIAAAVPASAASVTLRNSTWRPNVTIEVRVGPHQKCDDDPARPPQTVAFGRSITLNGRVICVRRDIDPANPTGTWGEWTIYEADIVDDIP